MISSIRKKKLTIVDYEFGNQSSLQSSCRQLGYRATISKDPAILDQSDLLLLPGVGAFPGAMENLHRLGLAQYLQNASQKGRGIIGICLGMQILTEHSSELGNTSGLGLIPGEVVPIGTNEWHIGWNNLESKSGNKLMEQSHGEVMYFNHSFCYRGPEEYISAVCRKYRSSEPIVAAIHRDHLIGLQFHPEKSQKAGLRLLERAIKELI